MRSLIRLAAKLYPGPWRARYGEEFEALLEDVGGGGRVVVDVLKGALLMRFQRSWKGGSAALLATAVLSAVSWWAGRRPYLTPGAHQVFRMDSAPGALLEFLVILALIFVGAITFSARQGRWLAPLIAASYVAVVALVSLLTPRTVVNIGDTYCWDLWCVGIRNVNAIPQGRDVLYTAEVSIFADTSTAQRVPAAQAKQFFYALDEQGRRFAILRDLSFAGADVVVNPAESVKSTLAFLAPANTRKLYLTGDMDVPPWVRLYFGSDLNPFHRRTLLRVL
ncbi:MAG TPA: hypothetical protein VH639_05785 [Bryobacteraceae bacterium]|jgi:hypothetical protein